ncbi:diacylglycerol kinase family lipid kinase [Actinomycetospora lutea]|uniref:diacylglycerol/lipid kinase family protein n=1 Tax=Actinomycetospora lutea TaxID=663604 RepID=UPI002366C883|nr:diacylglycerol kinase family protein [Actinomycetospora lutea]MDD7940058.1 diacylglycerol kinase family lipid kinase [Actinomycetospora lutea]
MRALLVANPSATTTTAAGQDVIAHALASEIKLDVVATRYRGHAAELAARARTEAVDLVIVLGGDGTVNEALNGLLADGPGEGVPALGVVPGGSANVFARALGVSREPLEATHRLLGALAEGRSRTVGLGRADERWFSFNAGLGWDADVIASMERARGRGHDATPARYVTTSVRRWTRTRLDPPDLTVEIAGEEPVGGVRLAIVSNTDPWTYLGARPVRTNPGCSFDGGLGLFALKSVGLPTVLRLVHQVLRRDGASGLKSVVRHDDVPALRITSDEPVNLQVDGDHLGQRSDVEFVAVPDALRVVV